MNFRQIEFRLNQNTQQSQVMVSDSTFNFWTGIRQKINSGNAQVRLIAIGDAADKMVDCDNDRDSDIYHISAAFRAGIVKDVVDLIDESERFICIL